LAYFPIIIKSIGLGPPCNKRLQKVIDAIWKMRLFSIIVLVTRCSAQIKVCYIRQIRSSQLELNLGNLRFNKWKIKAFSRYMNYRTYANYRELLKIMMMYRNCCRAGSDMIGLFTYHDRLNDG